MVMGTLKTYLILIWCALVLPSRVFSQAIDTLSFSRTPLDIALFKLARASEKNILFPDSLLSGYQITGYYSDEHLVEILYDISCRFPVSFIFESDSSISVAGKGERKTGNFKGIVHDAYTGEPIPNCLFYFEDSRFFVASTDSGTFSLKNVPSGIYKVRISRLGYRFQSAFVCFNPKQNALHQFALVPSELRTEEIVVLNPVNQLTAEKLRFAEIPEIRSAFNYYQDLLRSVQVIPGIRGNEISSSFSVNGGHPDENKIILNNLELLAPYHFDNFFNLYGTINPDLVETYQIYRDGYPVRFGNRMSGVLEMQTASKPGRWKLTTDYYATSFSGSAKWNAISAVASYRNGNLTPLFKNAYGSNNLHPVYEDFFLSLESKPAVNHRIQTNLLTSWDHFAAKRTSNIWTPNISSTRKSLATWIQYDWMVSTQTLSATTLSFQTVDRLSEFDFYNSISKNNPEKTTFRQIGISQEFTADWYNGQLIQFGAEGYAARNSYLYYENRYGSSISEKKTSFLNTALPVFRIGLWAQYTANLTPTFVMMGGLRSDVQNHQKDIILDPRVSFLWSVSDPLLVKLTIGHYSQYQPFDRLDIGSGADSYSKPEKSVQIHTSATLSLENDVVAETGFYLKNYYRMQDDQTFNFEDRFMVFNPYPDQGKPTNGIAQGMDILFKRTTTGHYWLISYSYGRSLLRYGANEIPRSFFHPWKLELAFGLKSATGFGFDLNWKNQSGLPYTEQMNPTWVEDLEVKGFFVEYAKRNQKLSTGNQFLKIKIDKKIEFKLVRMTLFAGIYNLFNLNEEYQKHKVSKVNQEFEIPINKKLEIPRVFFAGLSLEGI